MIYDELFCADFGPRIVRFPGSSAYPVLWLSIRWSPALGLLICCAKNAPANPVTLTERPWGDKLVSQCDVAQIVYFITFKWSPVLCIICNMYIITIIRMGDLEYLNDILQSSSSMLWKIHALLSKNHGIVMSDNPLWKNKMQHVTGNSLHNLDKWSLVVASLLTFLLSRNLEWIVTLHLSLKKV